MKNIITILFLLGICTSFIACGSTSQDNKNISDKESEQINNAENEKEKSEVLDTSEVQDTSGVQDTSEIVTETKNTMEITDSADTLVVYFSNTGNTKSIAEKIAAGLGANIYEIIPEDPYTDEDLDYNDDRSRSTIEMNDPSARPAIAESIENMEQYDTIYLGYPIWWAEAPRIIDTFVESYDFTDKTVIPFCTSGGSGIGSSAETLEELAGSGNWQDGHKFNGNESDEEVMEWVNGQ